MTCAFQAAFSRWTVGFGIEGQWNALRAAVNLPRLPGLQEKAHNLDYALLVRPHVVAATLTGHYCAVTTVDRPQLLDNRGRGSRLANAVTVSGSSTVNPFYVAEAVQR